MQLFKALVPVKVLSFDLDDTLYDNKPVIAAAEQAMLQALARHAPVSTATDSHFWWQQRRLLAKADPQICHDIGRWRLLGIEAGLITLGVARRAAGEIAELVFAAFLAERTRISVHAPVKQLLTELAQYYRLIAITNGNACINKMGIGKLFEFSLRAGPDGRMKPFPDMYLNAAARLNLPAQQILHIGDSPRADVMGALHAGCQAAWLDLLRVTPAVLPHLRITDLQQLRLLLP
jgi:FMN hydrolase / 5-amino-6-(5-phospho-D-ribitylamino)uracil phosphatase